MKPTKPTKPTSKPLSGLYRVELINPTGRDRTIEAAREENIKKALAEMGPRREYITANVYQYGMPVQIFPRLVDGQWFAAVPAGPLAHLAKHRGGMSGAKRK